MPERRAAVNAVACLMVLLLPALSAGVDQSHAESPAGVRPVSVSGPQPGDVYREYATHNGGGTAWRVTDPTVKDGRAHKFLPNPSLKITIDDLRGAVRAEALLDRWGGHAGTTRKRIRFNGHDWIPLPELLTTPTGHRAEMYYFQDNPVVPVPLEQLVRGENTFTGSCGPSAGWGQWGLYSLILRIYYDPQTQASSTGRIVSPTADSDLGENPLIRVVSPDTDITRVDLLAWYDGFDEDGDGVFSEWHESYHQPVRGQPASLQNHVGTALGPPFEVTWRTRFVPDQARGTIKLIARIKNVRDLWSVTDPIEGLSLVRTGHHVKTYGAVDVPERFGVRTGRSRSCTIPLDLSGAAGQPEEARLHLRTWHGWDGHHAPFRINGFPHQIGGQNHHFDYDMLPIPIAQLRDGENVFRIQSDTSHHMLEVLWPGPAITIRYKSP